MFLTVCSAGLRLHRVLRGPRQLQQGPQAGWDSHCFSGYYVQHCRSGEAKLHGHFVQRWHGATRIDVFWAGGFGWGFPMA